MDGTPQVIQLKDNISKMWGRNKDLGKNREKLRDTEE